MLDVASIVESGSLLIIGAIIFAESGLLVGFFLPGDTLLFAAGLAASQGELSIFWLIVVVIAAAVAGDNVGYEIGRRTGSRIFRKEDGIIFRQEYLERAEVFYKRHGGKTIILARFTPIVRTFAPVVAGASKMDHRRFFMFNVIGGILWALSMPLLGYWLGSKIPGLDKYIESVIIAVVALSLAGSLGHMLKDKHTRRKLITSLRKRFKRPQ